MVLAHTLEAIQGKTALLAGLSTELTEITASIETAPPYVNALQTITTIIDSARTRLAAERENLLPLDA